METTRKGVVAMNKHKTILVTESDFERIQSLIESCRSSWRQDLHDLDTLEGELDKAKIVKPADIPPNVVTMNSRVRVKDITSGREFVCQIVFPKDADSELNRISILAPIGTALLGYRTGSTVEWQMPSGTRRLKVLSVEYQPEAAGRAADNKRLNPRSTQSLVRGVA
jgi:regulator of nucleoside diphosphate kinase